MSLDSGGRVLVKVFLKGFSRNKLLISMPFPSRIHADEWLKNNYNVEKSADRYEVEITEMVPRI